MNLVKIYMWLCDLPLRRSIPLLLVVGLLIAITMPALPAAIQNWVITFVEKNWN